MRVNRSISIADIAKRTRLSESTISRALRGKGEISESTRTRVMEAARRLGYRPNLHVKAIQSGTAHIVGVIGDILTDPEFRGRVFEGIHDTLTGHEYLTVLSYPQANKRGADELSVIYRLMDHRVDGLIFFPSTRMNLADKLKQVWDMDFPLVAVDFDPGEPEIDFVGTDDVAGGQMAAGHLLGLGHRHFLFLTEQPLVEGGTSLLRHQGFVDCISRVSSATCQSVLMPPYQRGSRDCTSAVEALRREPSVTAVFAWNDLVAQDVYAAAHRLGLRIPEDLSVVGFGDLNSGHILVPALTTFEQFPSEIGTRAAELLLDRLRGGRSEARNEGHKIRVKPKLLERRSTAAPRT